MDNIIIHNETDAEAIANFKHNLPADYRWIEPSPELVIWRDTLQQKLEKRL